ncbi:MAG TPA: M23 family metallopeptidase [Actinomycetota bacterium]|nr:M23 family metallopeptidase [Actinomycetota bacterium]
MRTTRLHRLAPALAYLLVAALAGLSTTASAQIPPIGSTPTPAPTPAPTPRPTAAPTPDPTPRPTTTPGLQPPLPGDTPQPTQSPPFQDPYYGFEPEDPGPGGTPASAIPPGFKIPVFPRTPARNTIKLVAMLEKATSIGLTLEEALLQGMGRFPVAGLSYWSDDWANPRFTPVFHLHEGLDIFADFGTPVRSPDRGVVTRVTDGKVGGLAVWTRGSDGTSYYFAHLQEVAEGIEAGTPVQIGTVLGTVGDSGNARGGAPHLHFEMHRPDPIPPKPFVDAWLAEAEAGAEQWVRSKVSRILDTRQFLRSESVHAGLLDVDTGVPGATPEYSMLLTLLDPVGGSVGLLPRIPLIPSVRRPPSKQLMAEFVRLHVEGGILSSLTAGPPADTHGD